MEASENSPIDQLPLDAHGSVRALGDRLVIESLTIDDGRAARVVRERAETGQDPVRTVVDAIEVGTRVLDREGLEADVDFVRAEFESSASALREQWGEQARSVVESFERGVERAFGEEGGAVGKVLDGFEQEIAEQIARNFDGERATAVQHQVKELVSRSIDERMQLLVRHLGSDKESNPLAEFKRNIGALITETARREEHRSEAMVEKLGELQRAVVELRERDVADQRVAEAEEAGTRKGRSFEERVHDALETIAEARGDVAVHTGDVRGEGGSKKGDTVVEIGAGEGPCVGRIVFEDKDRQLSKNKMREELNGALVEREADFAVLVVAGEERIPAGQEQLTEYEGNKMIVAVDVEEPDGLGLALAYRYARLRVLTARDRSLEVDAGGVRDAAECARAALKRVQAVRLALTSIDKSAAKARDGVDDLVAEVEGELSKIESLVATAAAE